MKMNHFFSLSKALMTFRNVMTIRATDNNDPHKRAAYKNLLDATIHHSRHVHGFDDESGG
jgi:hypothetical protein